MRTVGDAIGTVRSLLGDTKGGWVKTGYVLPIMSLCCSDILLYLKAAAKGMNLAAVVPVLNVPAGTTSLYPWQAPARNLGQDPNKLKPVPVLAGLADPIQVFAKPAGSAPENYAPIRQRSTLPHLDPDMNSTNAFSSSMRWSWLGNQLLITPTNIALDIEVTGRFSAPPLSDPDMLIPGGEDLWIPLCFDTAAVAGIERSNPSILEGYSARAQASKDNLAADIVTQGQGAPARFQKVCRDSGNGYIAWFWGL